MHSPRILVPKYLLLKQMLAFLAACVSPLERAAAYQTK